MLAAVGLVVAGHMFRYVPIDIDASVAEGVSGTENVRIDGYVWDRWRHRLCVHSRAFRRDAEASEVGTREFDVTVFSCFETRTPAEARRLLRQQLEQDNFP